MQSNQKIYIAGLAIDVCVDDGFINIKQFLNKFRDLDKDNQNANVAVHLLKASERSVRLSQDWTTLFIAGWEIDDLMDPFNLIGITQAIFRFAAIHLAKRGVFLLHGSTAVLDNKIICFGDDGNSTAKTLGSLEVALTSNQYIADEFCFIDAQDNKIFGYPFIPLHVRSIVKKHLEIKHGLALPHTIYKKTVAGDFFQPNELFSLTTSKLEVLSYIHFAKTNGGLEKLSQEDSYRSFKFCIATHIAKLLYPELDRMQFVSMKDSVDSKIITEEVVDQIISKLVDKEVVTKMVQKILSLKLTVSEPCQVVSLLRAEI